MEKKRDERIPWLRIRSGKQFLTMRMVLFVCCAFCTHLASGTVAQEKRMDISVKEMSIESLIQKIKSEIPADFLYNLKEIERSGKVSLELKDASVDQILTEAFRNKPLRYSVTNGVFVIQPRGVSQEVKKILIRGKVTDEKGVPLPGVTVVLDSTRIGTATDSKGIFSMLLPMDKGVLTFTSIGYQANKVRFKYVEGQDIMVQMKESISSLDEVRVVAYGETTKRTSTGSVSVVTASDIKGIPSPSLSNLLQGRVAGMDVTNVSGAPGGGGTQVTIRGYNSLNIESGRRYSNPLWVVDGVPMNTFTSPVTGTNGLSDLNPETIESIQILKDASATSLYGSRAANGVIIVTTKKGKKNQKAQFDVNFSYTGSVLPAYPVITGGKMERDFRLKSLHNYRVAEYSNGGYKYTDEYTHSGSATNDYFWAPDFSSSSGNSLQDSLNPYYNNSTNFFKYYFQTGKILNANIQTSGGTDRMTYSVGMGYYKETGIMKSTGFSRMNLMGNFNFTPVERLSVDFRTYLSVSDRSRGGAKKSGTGFDNVEYDIIPGDAVSMSTLLPGASSVVDQALSGLRLVEEKNTTYRLREHFGLGYDIIEGLKLTANLSLDYTQNNRNNFGPSAIRDPKESLSEGAIARDMTLLNEDLLTYKRTIAENHNLDIMLGFSYQYDEYNYIGGHGENGPSDMVHYVTQQGWPNFTTRDNGQIYVYKEYSSDFTQKKMMSYFGRLNYNYKQKYLFTATIRRDGSSVFGRDHRWAIFPSGAVAWNFSEEEFMNWLPSLDLGKIRVSYGVSGNQFFSPYLAYGILNGSTSYDGQPTLAPDWSNGYYNPALSWEQTRQTDLGLDLSFMEGRLTFTFDYYYRYTTDMLYNTVMPGTYIGYHNEWRNAAEVSNKGVEFEIKYDIFRKPDLFWNFSVNLAKNWNRFEGTWNGRDLGGYVIGKSIGSIYGYKTTGTGIIQSEEEIQRYSDRRGFRNPFAPQGSPQIYYGPGDLNYVDVDGNHSSGAGDDQYLGSSIPKLYGGIVNEFSWKGLDLNMLWSFSLGRDMVNDMRIASLATVDQTTMKPYFVDLRKVTFWEKEGDQSDYPILAADNFNGSWASTVDRYVERVNYLKLKTVTIGYTLPKKWLGESFIRDIRLFFSGENLATFTNYSGMDPETVDINTGIDQGRTYPLARKLTVGVTIKL